MIRSKSAAVGPVAANAGEDIMTLAAATTADVMASRRDTIKVLVVEATMKVEGFGTTIKPDMDSTVIKANTPAVVK